MAKERKTITAQNIRPSNVPERNDGVVIYKMIYVKDGAQFEVPCTREIYKQIQDESIPRQIREDFKITFSKDEVAEHISSVDKVITMGNLNRVPEEGAVTGPDLIAVKLENGEYAVDYAPANCNDATSSEVTNLLTTKAASLKPGFYLDDERRFTVKKVVQETDATRVYVSVV